MVRIMKKDGNRLEGIGERIDVRLTLIEEALGMTPGDPEIYGNWIASKAPEPEVGEEEVGVIEGMDAVEDATTCFSRTEDGVPFCWDYQIKGFFKDACSSLRRVPGTRSSKLTAFKKVIDGTVFVEQRKIPFRLPEGAQCGRCERPLRASSASGERVALAASETVPAGTVLEFSVLVMNPKDAETVREWLDYGRLRGLTARPIYADTAPRVRPEMLRDGYETRRTSEASAEVNVQAADSHRNAPIRREMEEKGKAAH